jgi:hypothetical protein
LYSTAPAEPRAGHHGNSEVIAFLLKAGAAWQEADPLWLKAENAGRQVARSDRTAAPPAGRPA